MDNTTSVVPSLEDLQKQMDRRIRVGEILEDIKLNAEIGKSRLWVHTYSDSLHWYLVREFNRLGYRTLDDRRPFLPMIIDWSKVPKQESEEGANGIDYIVHLTKNPIITREQIEEKTKPFVEKKIRTIVQQAANGGSFETHIFIPDHWPQGYIDYVAEEFELHRLKCVDISPSSRSITVSWKKDKDKDKCVIL